MVKLKRTIAVLFSAIALILGMGLAAAPTASATGEHKATYYSYHYNWRCDQAGITYIGNMYPTRPHTLTKIWYRTTRVVHSDYYKYWFGYADHLSTAYSHSEQTWFYC